MAKIDAFFQLMNEQGASDLHLVTGQQPPSGSEARSSESSTTLWITTG
jgi:hypothetical protein